MYMLLGIHPTHSQSLLNYLVVLVAICRACMHCIRIITATEHRLALFEFFCKAHFFFLKEYKRLRLLLAFFKLYSTPTPVHNTDYNVFFISLYNWMEQTH